MDRSVIGTLLVSSVLVTSIIGKAMGWSDAYWLSEWQHWALMAFESVLLVGLWTSLRRTSLLLVLLMSATGLAISWMTEGRDCGCFGSLLTVHAKHHAWLLGALGAAAAMAWPCQPTPTGPRQIGECVTTKDVARS